jgi:hypothetical protein
MNAGPYSPPPADAPPPSEPLAVPGEPQAVPGGPQAAPEAPPPGYYPPPQYGAGPPPPRQRNFAPLIAGLIVVVVIIAAVGGYVVAGVAFAQTKLNNAHSAYNKVVDHQNSLTETVNNAKEQLTGSDVSGSSTATSIQGFKTTIAGLVAKSQEAQSQIATDDASLASADAGLKENQWLTVLSRSQLDKESAKIGHERKALAAAKVLTADYVEIGNFYEAFADVFIDFDALATKAQGHDVSGAAAASDKLKTDTTKAISLDKAPGLPAEVDTLLHNVQNIGTDFTSLINAAAQGNDAGVTAAENALQADVAKVEAFDATKADSEINAYYQPLIDSYNSEVDKANAG